MSTTKTHHTPQQFVDDKESLWRRIHSSWIKRYDDGTCCPSSAAFKGKDISVDVASKTNPQKSIRNSAALAGFLAEVPIKLGYLVIEDPVEDNDAHALIKGNITKTNAKKIANASEWVVEPKVETLN